MALIDDYKALTQQLFPTGRGFKITPSGFKDKLYTGLIQGEIRLYNDALATLYGVYPNSPGFTADDASAWEVRLGLIDGSANSLSDREAVIAAKMNHPGIIHARQHYLYIQGQLQANNFNVYVYENIFSDGMGGFTTKSPDVFSLLPFPKIYVQHSKIIQHGNIRHGYISGNKCVNHIEQSLDDPFAYNIRDTFFIGGSIAGQWAVVPATRKNEFRQLILKLKPAQMCAFTLVNYY